MSAYNPNFVSFYDTFMGDYTRQRSLIKELIKKYHPEGRRLLEIACGTGNMLLPFVKTHTLTGLDISREMIEIAQKKIPQAKFYHGDMSTFDLKQKFDTVLCFYDSINHLHSFKNWESTFARVAKHLDKNGIFVFDIATIYRMAERAKEPILVKKRKNIFITAHVTKEDTNTFTSRFQIIHKTQLNTWECLEQYVTEKCYEVEKIKKALEKYFMIEKIVDPFQKKPSKTSIILLFVCRKRSS